MSCYTCAFSGLPITSGTKVRYILVTENPYHEGSPCYAHDLWVPRTPPLRVTYCEFGNVELIDSAPYRTLWQDGLQLDLTESVPPFDHFLLNVSNETWSVRKNWEEKRTRTKIPAGVPTRKRVLNLLVKANQPLASPYGTPGFTVRRLAYGVLRIRWDEINGSKETCLKRLQQIMPLLRNYLLTAGTSCTAPAELLVGIPPHLNVMAAAPSPFSSRQKLKMNHVMVRDDVWERLLKLPGDEGRTAQMYRDDAYKLYEQCVDIIRPEWTPPKKTKVRQFPLTTTQQIALKCKEGRPPASNWERVHALDMLWQSQRSTPVSWMLLKPTCAGTVDLSTHWKLLYEKRLPLEEVKPLIDRFADLIFVFERMQNARWYWRPSYMCGGSHAQWKESLAVLDVFRDVAAEHVLRCSASEPCGSPSVELPEPENQPSPTI